MRATKPPYTLLILTPTTTTTKILRPLPLPPLPKLLPCNRNRTRTLTSTPALLKKGGKQDSKRTVPHNAAIAQSHSGDDDHPETSATVDAFDFSDYRAAIGRAHERLRGELSRIKASGGAGGGGGGRSTAEEIEGVRVSLLGGGGGRGGKGDRDKGKGKSGGGKGKEEGGEQEGSSVVKLGDVASVVARGRNVGVLVGEKEHLKPILQSLSSLSSLPNSNNLTYTTSPTDPLTILVSVPPVTAESRSHAQKVALKKGEEALFALREARSQQRKRHRRMGLGRLVGPDELFRAEREVERMNEGAVGEARGLVEGCRRGLEGGVM